jgi:hypothetical protein
MYWYKFDIVETLSQAAKTFDEELNEIIMWMKPEDVAYIQGESTHDMNWRLIGGTVSRKTWSNGRKECGRAREWYIDDLFEINEFEFEINFWLGMWIEWQSYEDIETIDIT